MFWVFSSFLLFFYAVLNGNVGGSEVLIKRARHVITEIKRTHDAAEALNRRDFQQVKKIHLQIKFFILLNLWKGQEQLCVSFWRMRCEHENGAR